MITRFQSFGQQVNLGFSQQQMIVQLTSLFGLVALALAAIGLYGVTAYAVAQRTSEIGIRMALGANRAHVQKMVLRDAFLQVGLGLLIGIPAAIAAGHLMAAELYRRQRVEPARPGNDDSGAGSRRSARGGAARTASGRRGADGSTARGVGRHTGQFVELGIQTGFKRRGRSLFAGRGFALLR